MHVDRGSLVVGGEGRDAELVGERQHVVLRRPDELASRLNDLAVAQIVVEGASADAVPCLEYGDAVSGGDELARGGQTGQTRADHDHVHGGGGGLRGRGR